MDHLLAYNEITERYDKTIGLGLYVSREFKKNEIVAEFIGDLKDVIAYEKYMVNSGRGGNAIFINNNYVLDCYRHKQTRKCLASYANCPKNCYDSKTNRVAKANMVLSINVRNSSSRDSLV